MDNPQPPRQTNRYTSPTGAPASDPDDKLVDALNTLESVASPTAYWYADDRNGIFDKLVEWQARRKEDPQTPPAAAANVNESTGAQRRLAVTMAGVLLVCAGIGAAVGLRLNSDNSARVAAAPPAPISSNLSQPLPPAPEVHAPGLTVEEGDAAGMSGEAPSVSISEAGPVSGAATGEIEGSSVVQGEVPPAAARPLESESNPFRPADPDATSVKGEEPVVVFTPRPESPPPAPRLTTSPQRNRRPRNLRESSRRSVRRSQEMSAEESRRIDRDADLEFQREYRYEVTGRRNSSGRVVRPKSGRRIYDEWSPQPLNSLDRKHPDWGWE
jgi:hypothetical protein